MTRQHLPLRFYSLLKATIPYFTISKFHQIVRLYRSVEEFAFRFPKLYDFSSKDCLHHRWMEIVLDLVTVADKTLREDHFRLIFTWVYLTLPIHHNASVRYLNHFWLPILATVLQTHPLHNHHRPTKHLLANWIYLLHLPRQYPQKADNLCPR